MKAEIKEVAPINVIAIRHIGPYDQIGPVFERLSEWAGKRNLFGSDTKVIGVYYDDPEDTDADQLRSDACISVTGFVKTEDDIVGQIVGGGKYAVATHHGSYEELEKTWNEFYGKWLTENGVEYREEPCFEMYLNSPHDTAPKDLITDIYIPVK